MMVYYENERIEIPEGCLGTSLADKLNLKNPEQALALKLNGKMVDLQTPLHEGDRVGFVNFEEKEGKEIFWHTSAHVLAQAILRLFPDAKPTIGPPIEAGFYYDFANLQISENDFEAIEKEALEIIKENFKPKRIVFENKKEALESFSKNPYKQELIESFEKGEISAYEQGEFFDLCRGPHLPALSKIKAFKILKTSGAYWRGDNSREMLTRVYAISFPDRKQLKDYLHMIEEAKKRDHRVIGNKLDLFSFLEEAPGMPFIHPKGIIIWNALLHFLRELQSAADYVEIKTPQIMNRALWEKSGHWQHYKENMYAFPIDEQEFAIKPMNCPGCMLYYKAQSHSYRDLPLRVSEIGHVFRHELSGALNGLFRVRSFHQDDAHLFMKPEDIKDEIIGILNLTKKIYDTFGISFFLELSTRPEKEKTIGSDEDWELSTSSLKAALEEFGMPFKINEGDGAFYGPKIDIHIKDALGRSWQCGTVQLDMALPQRFELKYTGNDGQEKRPLMLHRAIFGSIERFFGILIEHFAGKFPLWLSPRQVRIVPVADRHVDYAQSLQKKIVEAGFICEIDATSESVSKKIRNAQIHQVNYMLTIGDKEVDNGTINLRTRDNVVHGELDLNTFIEKIAKERDHRDLTSPFSPSGAS